MPRFAILVASGSQSTFVKSYDFFVSQGGLKEDWGKNWRIVEAPDLQGARMIAIHQPDARQDFGLFCGDCGDEKHGGVCRSPRCKRCGKERPLNALVFCGSACCARWEAHDRLGAKKRDET